MEDYVEEKGMMKEARYAHDKMMTETCDCSIKQIPGFSFEVVFFYWFIYIPDLKRDSSICSAKDRLIKNPSLILDINYKKEKLDKSVTKLLILLTLLSIFFLFWIQNSHYHLIDNLRKKYQTKYGYWKMHSIQASSSVNIIEKYLVHWSNLRFSL